MGELRDEIAGIIELTHGFDAISSDEAACRILALPAAEMFTPVGPPFREGDTATADLDPPISTNTKGT